MGLVVVDDVADHLVEHGEEGVEGPQASEVHDVVQPLSILQRLHHQPIRGKVGAEQVGTIVLNLGVGIIWKIKI